MLPRISKKLFVDLALWMLGFGFLMGISFPYFMLALGFDKSQVLTPEFYSATLIAGFLVALINFAMVRSIIGRRLALQTERMRSVSDVVRQQAVHEELELDASSLKLIVDSDDDVGDAARSFNELIDSLGRSTQVAQDISRFTKMVSAYLDVEGLTRQALEQLQQDTLSLAGAFYIVHDGQLMLMAGKGINHAGHLEQNEMVLDALKNNVIQRIHLPDDIQVAGVLTEFRPREVMLIPIFFKGISEAIVILASQDDYAEDMEQVLARYTPGLGLALRNALSHERLQRLAVLDPLTNVYNRRFGLGRLEEEYSRVVRDSSSLSVMMLDIDDFKVLNDTYGHMVGDKVIVNVVRCIKDNLREGDVLVRYGGEEFLIILPGASVEDGQQVGERIRRTIDDSFLLESEQQIWQTVSVGLSACPDSRLESGDDLIRLADEALYIAKENGKNRLITA
ncbi:MAG: GGDEF domain-containing protein [Gammaproteobacteria bacterium]|nr:GGDEF domain-containing protein [Gammaproteobacteria bacterium]